MVWISKDGPKCPVSPEDRGEFMRTPALRSQPSTLEAKGTADAVREALKQIRHYCDENLGPSRSSLLNKIAKLADDALALPTVTGGEPDPNYKWGTDYGTDLLKDINQLAHAKGTGALHRDVLQRAYREIKRPTLPSPKAAGDETSKLYADPRIPPSPDARAAVIEATRLLRKIVDLAYDENVAEPLDDAVSYANKALAALSQAPAADGDKLPPDWKQDQAETSRLAPSHTRPHHHTKAD